MAGGENTVTDQALRDSVIRTEEAVKHMAQSVTTLTEAQRELAVKTSENIKDLHSKVERHKKHSEDSYVSKDTHQSLAAVVKGIAGALVALALGAVSFVLYGKP